MTYAAVPTPHHSQSLDRQTSISSIDTGLQYRGYPIDELVEQSTFLETAYVVVKGDLPSQEQLADMQAVMSEAAVLDDDILTWIERLPLNVPAIDVLRTAASLLAL